MRKILAGAILLLFILFAISFRTLSKNHLLLARRWDMWVIQHHFDLALPFSQKDLWMDAGSDPIYPYTRFTYKWSQRNKPSKTEISLACLGHYQLSVNGVRVYHGPSFGVKPIVYSDTIDISSYIKQGENHIDIICIFVDGVTHEYPRYPLSAVYIRGSIPDGLWPHTLADQRLWTYELMKEVTPVRRLFNAGYVESYDLTQPQIVTGIPNPPEIKYSVQSRPLPLLQYSLQPVKRISTGVYDLGQFSTGYLNLHLNSKSTCHETITIGVNLNGGIPVKYMDQQDDVIFPAGETNWEQISRRSGRYIGLSGDCKTDDFTVSFTRVYRQFVEPQAPVKLSDLDRHIFELSLNSLRNGIQDHIEDSVDREKATYLGDALSVSKCLLSVPGNEALIKQSILQYAQRQNHDGSLPSMAPSGNNQFIPGYALQWPTLLGLYLDKTGDKEFALTMWPHLTRLMQWAADHESPEGFFYNKFGEQDWWEFVDWTPIALGLPYSTPNQLWYLSALQQTAKISQTVGQDPRSIQLKAEKLKQNLVSFALDSKTGVFADSFQSPTVRSDSSVVTNALAGSLELFPSASQSAQAVDSFRSHFLTQSAYSQSWVVDWLIKTGNMKEALDVLRQYWGGMVSDGATSIYEKYEPGVLQPDDKDVSYSHAWGCSPVYQYGLIP